jgi:hypothetical protein
MPKGGSNPKNGDRGACLKSARLISDKRAVCIPSRGVLGCLPARAAAGMAMRAFGAALLMYLPIINHLVRTVA